MRILAPHTLCPGTFGYMKVHIAEWNQKNLKIFVISFVLIKMIIIIIITYDGC